jgi:hypothetical protein
MVPELVSGVVRGVRNDEDMGRRETRRGGKGDEFAQGRGDEFACERGDV